MLNIENRNHIAKPKQAVFKFKLMLYPAMHKHHNKEAKEQFEQHFPNYIGRMRGIHMPEIIEEGGALHCISWVISN